MLEEMGSDDDGAVSEEEERKEKKFHVIKSYSDIQRLKLEKLMANPDKPVRIPARPVDHEVNRAAEFNHNVMGSSAGAGSGEFHLYRQMRRKEQSRVKQLAYRKKRDELDAEFQHKLQENDKTAAERTEKKRLKRIKKKEKKKKKPKVAKQNSESEEESDSDMEDTAVVKSPITAVDPQMQEPLKKDPLIIYYN